MCNTYFLAIFLRKMDAEEKGIYLRNHRSKFSWSGNIQRPIVDETRTGGHLPLVLTCSRPYENEERVTSGHTVVYCYCFTPAALVFYSCPVNITGIFN